MRITYYLFFILIFFNLNGCKRENKNNVSHPTKENIIDRKSITKFIKKTNLFDHSLSKFFKKDNAITIGSNEKNKPDLFGEIIDIEIDKKNNIWILDSQSSKIKIFSMDKNLVSDFGQVGDGPNEFRNIVGIEIIGDSLLTAEMGGRIKIFKFDFQNKQEQFKFIDQYTIPFGIDDFCHTKNHLFLSGVHTNKSVIENNYYIHRLDNKGQIDISFGEVYKSKNWVVSLQLSRASIECSPDNDIVLSTIDSFPYIHAFNESGQKIWIDQIEPFQQGEILSGYKGKHPYISFETHKSHDRILNLSILENKNIAIQVLESNSDIIEKLKKSINPTIPLYNIILNTMENKPILINKGFDYKIESMSEKYFVGYTNHPYPHVIIIKE